jgi:hypothetical protein
MVMIFPNTCEEAERAPNEIRSPLIYVNGEGNGFGRPIFTSRDPQRWDQDARVAVSFICREISQGLRSRVSSDPDEFVL